MKDKCEHCGIEISGELQKIYYAGHSAWLCWKCIAAFDNEIEDVVLKYLY